MDVTEVLKYKPYSYKARKRLIVGWNYSILYEDTEIRTFYGDYKELQEIVFLLNAAYHNGVMNGYSLAEMEKHNG
jgi:hypothetical protein